jgi:hypothetical protein
MNNDFIIASINLAKAVKYERDAYEIMGCSCPKDAIQEALEHREKAFKEMKEKMNGK